MGYGGGRRRRWRPGGSGGGSGSSGGSGYRRVGDDRTANLFVDNITNRDWKWWNRSRWYCRSKFHITLHSSKWNYGRKVC